MTEDQNRHDEAHEAPSERPRKPVSAIDGRLPPELLARLAATLNADGDSTEADRADVTGADE